MPDTAHVSRQAMPQLTRVGELALPRQQMPFSVRNIVNEELVRFKKIGDDLRRVIADIEVHHETPARTADVFRLDGEAGTRFSVSMERLLAYGYPVLAWWHVYALLERSHSVDPERYLSTGSQLALWVGPPAPPLQLHSQMNWDEGHETGLQTTPGWQWSAGTLFVLYQA